MQVFVHFEKYLIFVVKTVNNTKSHNYEKVEMYSLRLYSRR